MTDESYLGQCWHVSQTQEVCKTHLSSSLSVGTPRYHCRKASSEVNEQFLHEDCRSRIWARTSNSLEERRRGGSLCQAISDYTKTVYTTSIPVIKFNTSASTICKLMGVCAEHVEAFPINTKQYAHTTLTA